MYEMVLLNKFKLFWAKNDSYCLSVKLLYFSIRNITTKLSSCSDTSRKYAFFDDILKNVLLKNDYYLAISKPNGVPMHSLKYTEKADANLETSDFISMSSFKSDLIKHFNVPDLFEVFTQKRQFGGIVLYCFNKDVQNLLSRYFKNAKINKHYTAEYMALSIGKMNKNEGVEAMTLEQNMINNNLMSTLVKEPSKTKQKLRDKYTTVGIKYKIINSSKVAFNCTVNNVAVWPTTTKRDSIEMFFIHKMSPILGDHIYSSRIRTLLDKQIIVKHDQAFPEPQMLPKEMCDLLNVPEKNTSSIPTHVHCTKLIIPELFKNKNGMLTFSKKCYKCELGVNNMNNELDECHVNIIDVGYEGFILVQAPLPEFYQEAMKRFKLF